MPDGGKNKKKIKLRHRLEYDVIVAFNILVRIMPPAIIYVFLRVLAFVAFSILRIRRDVALENIHRAFPGLHEKECRRIAGASYYHMGMTFVEMLMIPSFAPRVLEIVNIADAALLHRMLNASNGLIIVSAHMGNWELMGASLAAFGFKLHPLAKRQSNPLVDDFITRSRAMYGMDVIHNDGALKRMVQMVKNKEAVVFVSDQDSGRRGVFVPFFGVPASTPTGAAQMALKYGTSVMTAFCIRLKPGRYRLDIREVPVDPNDTVEDVTIRFTRVIEEMVERYPEQYFWMHRRWKTRAPASKANMDGGGTPGFGREDA